MDLIKYQILAFFVLSFIVVTGCSSSGSSRNNPNFDKLITGNTENNAQLIDTNTIDRMAREYIIRGSTYQQQFRYAEAILEFQEALRYDSSASILYVIGKSYKELDKMNSALEFLQRALKKEPRFIPAMEQMAEIYILMRNIDGAVTTYERIVELQPNVNNRLILARLYSVKSPSKAITLLEDILNSGEDYNVLTRLSELYEQVSDTLKYQQTLEKLYKFYPNDNRTAISLLESYVTKRDYEKAFELFSNINNATPSSEFDIYVAFMADRLMDDTSSAADKFIPEFLKYVDNRFMFDWRINLMGGYLAGRINDSITSEKYFTQALKVTDTIPDIPLQVGFYYMQKSKFQSALNVFYEYSGKYPEDARFPFFAGLAFTSLDENEKALEALRTSLNIDRTNVDAWAQIGIIYDRLGMQDSSDYAYITALKIDPKDPLVNNNYAYSLSERGIELERALEMSRVAVSSEPGNPSYLDTYGWVQFKLGNYDQALEYITKAIENEGASAEVYEHLGDVFEQLDKHDEAEKAWKKGLEYDPYRVSLKKRLNLLE